MKVTKKDILTAMKQADEHPISRSTNLTQCYSCWIHYLTRIVGINQLNYPCTNLRKILNEQYKTNYSCKPGNCSVNHIIVFPREEILSKIKRSLKI